MSTPEKRALLALQGMLFGLPKEQQDHIVSVQKQLKELVLAHGEDGSVALVWLTLELAVEAEKL